MDKDYPIQFPGDDRFTPERSSSLPEAFQTALRRIHESGDYALCLCPGKGDRKLYVSRHGEAYRVARFPNSGLDHAPDCRFFATPAEMSGLAGYQQGVVTEAIDGSKKVRLKIGLTRKAVAARQEREETEEVDGDDTTPDKAVQRKSQAAMTDLGLLQFLWTEASLNRWHPGMNGKRFWSTVGHHAHKAAELIRVGRTPLSQVLLVIQPERGDEWLARAKQRAWKVLSPILADRDRGVITRAVVVGEVRSFVQNHDRMSIALYDASKYDIKLMAEHKLVSAFTKRFPDVMTELQNRVPNTRPDCRAIGLFLVEMRRTEDGAIGDVLSGGLMLTTQTFIPYSSSYEKRVADLLFSGERYFEKPLRFDAHEEVIFPDFLLFDTQFSITPMEVYGRDDPDYIARRDKKRAIYPRCFPGVEPWEWFAVDHIEPPPLPPKQTRTT
jgi:hypothetical protein